MRCRRSAFRIPSTEHLSNATQFFADQAAQRSLKAALLDVTLQRFVDETLVIAATRFIDLAAEPVDHFVIKADGDPRFARGRGDNGATLGFREIVFSLHMIYAPSSSRGVLKLVECWTAFSEHNDKVPPKAVNAKRDEPRLSTGLTI